MRQHNNNGSYNNNRNSSYNKSSTDKPKSGLTVEVRNGDVTKALRIFKKKVAEAGIIQEVRDRQEFVKPSKKRARAKASFGKWAGTQSKITPMPRWCSKSMRYIKSCGVP